VIAVAAVDRQATQVDEMMGEVERQRSKVRLKAGELAIDLLLQGSSIRSGGRCLDVYLPVSRNVVRVAYSSETPLELVEWNCPAGATGYAFTSGKRVVARGENARNETYQLDEGQRGLAQSLEIVAAEPIKNQANRTIGVLSVYGPSDDGFLTSDEGMDDCQALAEAISRILIDVCGLETDNVTAN
jgi:hypothetical protein